MIFTFLTLFPEFITSYFGNSILRRAIDSNTISVDIINFRDFSYHKFNRVDNYQVGGGPSMIIGYESLSSAIKHVKKQDSHIIYLTPSARKFHQNDAIRLARDYSHIIFICGRYGGIDERVVEDFVDEVFCVGDFILTGGELPSLIVCDSISRNISSVLGNNLSLMEESFSNGLLEAPVFAKSLSNVNKDTKSRSPSEYSKGNHSRIAAFKHDLSLCKTKYFRPDIYKGYIN